MKNLKEIRHSLYSFVEEKGLKLNPRLQSEIKEILKDFGKTYVLTYLENSGQVSGLPPVIHKHMVVCNKCSFQKELPGKTKKTWTNIKRRFPERLKVEVETHVTDEDLENIEI